MEYKTTVEKRAASKKYYEANKEKIRAYYKNYRADRNNVQIKDRKPTQKQLDRINGIREMSKEITEKDLEIMYNASKIYCAKLPYYLDYHEVLGDAYVGLANAIRLYSPEKSKNRDSYLYQKVKYYLVDCFRRDYGRETDGKKSRKREMLRLIVSLNIETFGDEGQKCEMIDILESNSTAPEVIMDARFFREKIKKTLNSLPRRRKREKYKYFELWEDYNIIGLTMKQVADKNNMSESRVSQLIKNTINPAFLKLQQEMIREYPDFVV